MQANDRDLPGDDVEELYAVLGGLLLRTLPDLLGISAEEAETVVYGTFVSFMTSRPATSASDWIVAAALQNAKTRTAQRAVPLTPAEPLTRREREAVHLALVEKMSCAEIAEAMDVSVVYAERLVRRATAKLRQAVEED